MVGGLCSGGNRVVFPFLRWCRQIDFLGREGSQLVASHAAFVSLGCLCTLYFIEMHLNNLKIELVNFEAFVNVESRKLKV